MAIDGNGILQLSNKWKKGLFSERFAATATVKPCTFHTRKFKVSRRSVGFVLEVMKQI